MKNIKWRVLLTVSLLALVSCIPLAAENASAAPAAQTLWPDSTVQSQLLMYHPTSPDMMPHEAVYSAAEYGTHEDTNGEYLFWGNATSASAGTFGVGVLKVGLSDPIGELASWYNVSFKAALMLKCGNKYEEVIVPSGDYLSVRFGVGYNSETLGYYEQMEPDYQPTSGSGGTNVHTCNPTGGYEFEHDLEERPFSLAEVQAMYMVIWLCFDSTAFALIPEPATPKSLLLLYVQAYILPEEYTPPPEPIPAQSFILRPDGDVLNEGLLSSEPTVFGALNETNYHSDADNSFVWDVPGTGSNAVLTMSDPEVWQGIYDYYRCTLWVIAKTNDTAPPDEVWWAALTGGSHYTWYGLGPLLGSYANHSQAYPCDGQSSDLNWSFGQLCNMTAMLMEFQGTNITMSQLAVIVTAFDFGPDGGAGDMSGMARFLMNGGFAAILGLLGFGLVCAAPIIMVVKNREDDTMMGFFLAILVGIFGLAFLWAGLTDHWG